MQKKMCPNQFPEESESDRILEGKLRAIILQDRGENAAKFWRNISLILILEFAGKQKDKHFSRGDEGTRGRRGHKGKERGQGAG